MPRDLKKRLLDDILRRVRIAQEPRDKADQGILVSSEKDSQRVGVALFSVGSKEVSIGHFAPRGHGRRNLQSGFTLMSPGQAGFLGLFHRVSLPTSYGTGNEPYANSRFASTIP